MHTTIKDNKTGDYIEICVPEFGRIALVVRTSNSPRSRMWDSAEGVAKAMGAEVIVRVDEAAVPATDTLSEVPAMHLVTMRRL